LKGATHERDAADAKAQERYHKSKWSLCQAAALSPIATSRGDFEEAMFILNDWSNSMGSAQDPGECEMDDLHFCICTFAAHRWVYADKINSSLTISIAGSDKLVSSVERNYFTHQSSACNWKEAVTSPVKPTINNIL
jgi:hypothetical protein